MQNRYVGDVGDFANNGLLRHLCGKPELPGCHPDSPVGKLKLGVVEYFNEPTGAEAKNRDGKRIQYLCTCPVICGPDNKRDYRDCDVPLYDALKGIVEDGKRKVGEVRRRGILPCPCESYHCAPISGRVDRNQWRKDALEKVREADIVFLNPDKGIRPEPEYDGNRPAHVYMRDLECFVQKEKSLVIYHHLTRQYGDAEGEVGHFSRYLGRRLGLPVYALQHHRGPTRFYFIVAQPWHEGAIRERLENFNQSQWCIGRKPHFTVHLTVKL